MKNYNFANSIIFCLYKYYKNDLYQARIAFCIFLLLFFYPILFYLNKLIDLGVTKFMLKLNLLTSLFFITGPLFIIVFLCTIKKDEIKLINEDEGEKFRKAGKNNILLLLSIILIMWVSRIVLYIIFKN
jgi:hypothetical protein